MTNHLITRRNSRLRFSCRTCVSQIGSNERLSVSTRPSFCSFNKVGSKTRSRRKSTSRRTCSKSKKCFSPNSSNDSKRFDSRTCLNAKRLHSTVSRWSVTIFSSSLQQIERHKILIDKLDELGRSESREKNKQLISSYSSASDKIQSMKKRIRLLNDEIRRIHAKKIERQRNRLVSIHLDRCHQFVEYFHVQFEKIRQKLASVHR